MKSMRSLTTLLSVVQILSLFTVTTPFQLAVSPRTSRSIFTHKPGFRGEESASMLTRKNIRVSNLKEKGNADETGNILSPSVWETIISKVGSTTSTVVAGTFFLALCYKRDAMMVSFFFGAIGNAIFGKVLKRVLNIERPDAHENSTSFVDRPSDNGMPSSHAMSLGFICTFVSLWFPWTTPPLMIYATISLIYRVKVNLHTVDQVVVGGFLGSFDGALWWRLCTTGFRDNRVVDLIQSFGLLNEQGLLPFYLLAVPALVGAAVVGSVERRLSKYIGRGLKHN